jgi:tetratricopeptide (TPR) repeat protein
VLGQVLTVAGQPDRAFAFSWTKHWNASRVLSKKTHRQGSQRAWCPSAIPDAPTVCSFWGGSTKRLLLTKRAPAARRSSGSNGRGLSEWGSLEPFRLLQRRYEEALQAYEEAPRAIHAAGRARLRRCDLASDRLGVPGGRTAGAAEDAYRQSLVIEVGLEMSRDRRARWRNWGTCMTPPSAARRSGGVLPAGSRQIRAKSAMWRTKAARGANLGDTLRNLRRFQEARKEIRRAIECKAQSAVFPRLP